jgi:hypothetical protein
MTVMKFAAAAALAGTLAAGATMSAHAAQGRNTAAAVGFGAGVLTGAAIANANNGYYYAPRYSRGYAYAPAYAYSYAEPGYVSAGPGYGAYAYAPVPRGGEPTCTAGRTDAC